MKKVQTANDFCCCGLFHKHTLAFVAGTFLTVSYAFSLGRRIYVASHTPTPLDGLMITAAAVGFLTHAMMVIGNCHRSKVLYIPSLVFNVIWTLDQARVMVFHSAFIFNVLKDAERYYQAAGVPHTYEKFITLVILDLIFTVGGVFIALGFFAVIFSGYRYLAREDKAEKEVVISAPVFSAGALPEKLPITEFA